MGNRFYAPGKERAGKVHDLFATIAPRYDLINDLQSFGLHRWWKRRLLQLARVQPGERALDLCCGTGDIALAMARTGAAVVGLDFSDRMLAVARERCRREGGDGVLFNNGWKGEGNPIKEMPDRRQPGVCAEPPDRSENRGPVSDDRRPATSPGLLRGDALRIPFCDEQFDVVTIGYGLRNLADCQAGLREMGRVLKPGGRLLVLDFGKPNNAIWRRIYFTYLRWLVPLFGRIFCGDSETHAYIIESLRHYPTQDGVAAFMREMHFRQIRIVNLMGGVMSINYGIKSQGGSA